MMNSKIYFFLCKKIFLNIKKNNGQEILLYFLQMAKKTLEKYIQILMNVTFRSSPKKIYQLFNILAIIGDN